MVVFKFGGASVKNADAVKNAAAILRDNYKKKKIVIVSAMGKTTNALEILTNQYYQGEPIIKLNEQLDKIKTFHYQIMDALFDNKNHPIYNDINNLFVSLEWEIEEELNNTFDFYYDQIVSVGELLSTKIISAYLNLENIKNKWIDVRDFIRTDNTYTEGKIDWETSAKLTKNVLISAIENHQIIVTQGFIGGTSENFTTTLGREGSDYSAAIISYLLNAKQMVIWKDVPGVLNADPKWFDDTIQLNKISYKEAIELAYYGATIIHPNTIKPLQNKKIPLYVKSFVKPQQQGTLISQSTTSDNLIPSFIFKINQVLISISPRDFSFIVEENLSHIYALFAKNGIKIHLIQNSAINLSVCVDKNHTRLETLLKQLKINYLVKYNEGLELVTIRHYDAKTITRVTLNKNILLEQKTRNTARFVMADRIS